MVRITPRYELALVFGRQKSALSRAKQDITNQVSVFEREKDNIGLGLLDLMALLEADEPALAGASVPNSRRTGDQNA